MCISLLALDQWTPNLARWQLTVRGFHPKSFVILSTRGHVRSRNKLKLLNLPHYKAYVTKFVHLPCIFTFIRLMATKFGRVVNSERTLRTQTFKSSPTSSFKLFYLYKHVVFWTLPQNGSYITWNFTKTSLSVILYSLQNVWGLLPIFFNSSLPYQS